MHSILFTMLHQGNRLQIVKAPNTFFKYTEVMFSNRIIIWAKPKARFSHGVFRANPKINIVPSSRTSVTNTDVVSGFIMYLFVTI